MEVNATLIGQAIVFIILIWFTFRFIWPPLLGAIAARQKTIADGLAAAERGQEDLDAAKKRADDIVREARERAGQIIDQAQHRANDLVDQAKGTATTEGQRLVAAAQQQIDLEITRAREALRREVAQIAVQAASKLLEREIDPRAHADLIDKLAAQI
jgi:F-type H+-transporting ATPase subunit b